MIDTYPDLGKILETLGTNVGARTRLLRVYLAVAMELVNKIDGNVNALLCKHGLQPTEDGRDIVIAKRGANTRSQVSEIFQEISELTYTMTGLANMPGELSSDNPEVVRSLVALRKLTATIKAEYNEINSILESLP